MQKIRKKELSNESSITLYDGFVLPLRNKSNTWGIGGVLDKDRNYLVDSGYVGWTTFGGSYEFEHYESSSDSVFWFGNLLNHWGHFLVDNITRIWWLVKNDSKNLKIAYVSDCDNLNVNIIRFFEIIGVESNRLVRIKNVTQYKEIIIPEISKNDNVYTEEYGVVFDKIVSYVKSNPPPTISYVKNVYFSRQSFNAAKNKELGESLIEKFYEDNGFTILYPEKLTLDEQVYIWNNADVIACINGTIPLNLCFCRNERLKLTVINKTSRPHQNLNDFIKIFNIKNVIFINSYWSFSDRFVRSLGGGPFVMNVSLDLIKSVIGNNYTGRTSLSAFENNFFLLKYLSLRYAKTVAKKILKK